MVAVKMIQNSSQPYSRFLLFIQYTTSLITLYPHRNRFISLAVVQPISAFISLRSLFLKDFLFFSIQFSRDHCTHRQPQKHYS